MTTPLHVSVGFCHVDPAVRHQVFGPVNKHVDIWLREEVIQMVWWRVGELLETKLYGRRMPLANVIR